MQFWLYDNTENLVAGVSVPVPWLWLGAKGKQGSPFWAISFARYLQKEVLNCNLQSICFMFANAKSEKYVCQNSGCVWLSFWFGFSFLGERQHTFMYSEWWENSVFLCYWETCVISPAVMSKRGGIPLARELIMPVSLPIRSEFIHPLLKRPGLLCSSMETENELGSCSAYLGRAAQLVLKNNFVLLGTSFPCVFVCHFHFWWQKILLALKTRKLFEF